MTRYQNRLRQMLTKTKYGSRGLVNYDFSKAQTIVSIGADFLGDWQGGGFDAGICTRASS